MSIPRYPVGGWPTVSRVPTDAYMGVPVPMSQPGPVPVDLYQQMLQQYWQMVMNAHGMLRR